LIPSAERYLGLRVSLPKDLKCLPCYYIHSHIMFPPWDQSKFPLWELYLVARMSAATSGAGG
jgi:hypothetical protein